MTVRLEVRQAGRAKRIVAITPYELREIAAALPGAVWDKTARVWTYPATIGTAARLHNAFNAALSRPLGDGFTRPAMHERVDADADMQAMLDWARRAVAARACRLADELPDPPSKTSAWLHQRRAFHWAAEQEAALLAMDMGTGKSKVVVDLCNAWRARKVLVLAPKSMLGGWRKQFDVHSLARYVVTRGEVYKRNGELKVTAKPAERIEAIDRTLWVARESDVLHEGVVVTVNYELAWREPFRSWLLGQRWDVGVLDEGHRARAAGGKTGMFVAALRDVCDRRLMPTGTPMPHSPLDLYGECRFLEPSLFGTSYERFKVRYGRPKVKYYESDVDEAGELVQRPVYLTDPGGKVIVDGVRDEVRDELADKLSSIAFHVTADEALDLPDELDDVVTVELDAKTSKAYRDLDRELVADIGAGVCTVDNALVRFLRLAQITSGHLPVEVACQWCDGAGKRGESFMGGRTSVTCSNCNGVGVTERVETIGTDKRDALADVLDGLPAHRIDPTTFEQVRREPVVVFARFTHDLMSIEQACKTARRGPYRELSGGRRDALTDTSELEPGTGVAGVQIQSGAEAVDFTLARLAVYYSLDFSLARYKQSRARTRRPGADLGHPVEYRHLVAVLDDGTPTIDSDVYEALEARAEVVEHVYRKMHERARQAVAA